MIVEMVRTTPKIIGTLLTQFRKHCIYYTSTLVLNNKGIVLIAFQREERRSPNIILILIFPVSVVNPCSSTPCANNGSCTALGPFNFTCQCAPGYTGATCEDIIDPCEDVTCPDNSVCVNGSICVCIPGLEGTGEQCVHQTTTGT